MYTKLFFFLIPLLSVIHSTAALADTGVKHQAHSAQQTSPSIIYFGFDIRNSPQEDARQYLSFLKYLGQATGYRFELRFTPRNRSLVDDLGQGKVQLAAIGATAYIQLREKYGGHILVRGINQNDRAEYQSFIVTSPDSPVKTVSDLRSKRFAFGSQSSTQGHLIPRMVLKKHAIGLEDLKSFIFTGSHYNCANSVISAKADACGMQDTLAQTLAERNQVRIIYKSPYYPSSGIAASTSLTQQTIDTIQKALLDFRPEGEHKDSLYNWDKTEMPNGFRIATESDYDDLRSAMISLGMLEPARR